MQKLVDILEKYVEWIALGVAALLGSLALFLIFAGMVSYLFYQTIVSRRELSVVLGSRATGAAPAGEA